MIELEWFHGGIVSHHVQPYLSGEVFQDGCAVYGGGGAYSAVAGRAQLQMSVDPSHGEL